jgi:cytochrome c-type biogenesis protein CcmH/NrfG
MGWGIAIGLAIVVLGAILLIARPPRSSRELIAAALLLGVAGYAWQGHPGQGGSARAAGSTLAPFDESLAEQRRAMGERFGPSGKWLVLSDGLGRQGNTKDAANILVSAVRGDPKDPTLWIGLGNAMVAHGDGIVSPAADYAYRRAIALDPQGPAARWFFGLALARSGQLEPARAVWAELLPMVPEKMPFHAELQANIEQIDRALSGQAPVVP